MAKAQDALDEPLALRLRDLLRLSDAPRTLGELVALAAARGRPPLERLLTASPTPHRVRWDGRQDFTPCILDALMLPFLLDTDAVEVETTTPVDHVAIRLTAHREGCRAPVPVP